MQRIWLVVILIIIIGAAVLITRPNKGEQPQQSAPTAQTEDMENTDIPTEGLAGSIYNDEARIATDAIGDSAEDVVAATERIRLYEPAPHTLVDSPFDVRGEARGIAGDTLTVRVVNSDGGVLISETAKVIGIDEDVFGQFRIGLSYVFRHGEEKTLEVFAEDNPEEKLSIPLRFRLNK